MLGLMLGLSGAPEYLDLEELFLRWVITMYDPDAEDTEDVEVAAVGNALAAACSAYTATKTLSNEALEEFVFNCFRQTWLVLIRRAIVSRGGDPQNRDEESAAEAWPNIEAVELHKVTLPRKTAGRLADAIADREVSRTVAMWDWYAKEEAKRQGAAEATPDFAGLARDIEAGRLAGALILLGRTEGAWAADWLDRLSPIQALKDLVAWREFQAECAEFAACMEREGAK